MSERLRTIPPEYQNLRFLGPSFSRRDLVDQALEILFPLPFRVETASTEENIPREGSLVFGFAPHSSWVEPFALEHLIRSKRKPPVWLAKIETQEDVPSFVLGNRRFIFISREDPEKSVITTALEILKVSNGSIAAAFEGTRKGNPHNRHDIRTLGLAKPGLVYFATRKRTPILPIVTLGGDQFLPLLEDVRAEKGTSGVIWEWTKAVFAKDKPGLQIRFAPPYTDHIPQEGVQLIGRELREHAQHHTDIIMREIIVPKILEIDPNYPLGPYEDVRSQQLSLGT